MPRKTEMVGVVALCVTLSACAGATGKNGPGRPGRGPLVAGIWEGVFQSTLADGIGAGDTRIEKQAWRLAQAGGTITGFYVVELTMISGDGRPYLCSREPRFSTLLRFDVRGKVNQEAIELDEVGDVQAKGPCRPSFRTPTHYRAALRGNVLTLTDGIRNLPLYRRPPAEAAAAERALAAFEAVDASWTAEAGFPAMRPFGAPPTADRSLPPVNLEGLWVWEHRGALPGGDEKVEREEWHLVQEGTQVSGYYDRAVHQISTDGHAYRCNSALDFRVVTRYQVDGEVRGSNLTLYERAFEVLEKSPCDDGRRRLDAYQGLAGPGEIRLVWGVGTQVLKRARPNVPTQRF